MKGSAEYSAFTCRNRKKKTKRIIPTTSVAVHLQERRIHPLLARRQRVPTASQAAAFASGHKPSEIMIHESFLRLKCVLGAKLSKPYVEGNPFSKQVINRWCSASHYSKFLWSLIFGVITNL